MQIRQRFRSRVEARDAMLVPGAYDCVSARLVEAAGFEALYLTGYGAAASRLGLPDLGFTGLADVAAQAGAFTAAVALPVVADADTGYGSAIHVRRTVTTLERAGVAAIQLEDQQIPKRCGHLSGHVLVPREELAARIRSAVEARTDPDLLVIARTDAISASGIDEALHRGEVALRAGADVLFVEAPRDEAELERIARTFEAPLLYNLARGGRSPVIARDRLRELGVSLVALPIDTLLVAARAVREHLEHLREDPSSLAADGPFLSFDDMNALLGLPEQLALAARYEPTGHGSGSP